MRQFLLFHAVLETLAGLLFMLYPSLLFFPENGADLSIAFVKSYGIIALCFGTTFLVISRYVDDNSQAFRWLYLIALGFHMAISFYLYSLYSQGIIYFIGIPGVHIFAFIIGIFIYLINVQEEKTKL